MTLWIVFAGMTAFALALLLRPLVRRPPAAPPREAFALEIYRDQLAELERDCAQGRIDAEQARAARAEIGRRMLALDGGEAAPAAGPRPAPRSAVAIGIAVPLCAFLLYADVGAPRLPDRPDGFAAGAEDAGAARRELARLARDMSPEEREAMIRAMVDGLAQRLRDQPDDVDGWLRLARSYHVLGEPEKSRDAYAEAARRRPDDADLLVGYAASVMRAEAPGVAPPPAFRAVMSRILHIDPDHRDGLWLAGLAARQGGDDDGARAYWTRLRALLEPGSPAHRALTARIETLGGAR